MWAKSRFPHAYCPRQAVVVCRGAFPSNYSNKFIEKNINISVITNLFRLDEYLLLSATGL